MSAARDCIDPRVRLLPSPATARSFRQVSGAGLRVPMRDMPWSRDSHDSLPRFDCCGRIAPYLPARHAAWTPDLHRGATDIQKERLGSKAGLAHGLGYLIEFEQGFTRSRAWLLISDQNRMGAKGSMETRQQGLPKLQDFVRVRVVLVCLNRADRLEASRSAMFL